MNPFQVKTSPALGKNAGHPKVDALFCRTRIGGCLLAVSWALTGLAAGTADKIELRVDATHSAGKVSPRLYGLMTEEINFSYDGGLYAELIRNRAFLDDAKEPAHWQAVSGALLQIDSANPVNDVITTTLRIEAKESGGGVANDGYWGIPVKPATKYIISFSAKTIPAVQNNLIASIVSEDGLVLASAASPQLTSSWERYSFTLRTNPTAPVTAKATLRLTLKQPGTAWLGVVSLFPPTWNDRANGLRPDLMQMLVDLKPKFLRFPGGNYLEGDSPETRFDWKKTLGAVERRPGHSGPWGYRSTDGMGLLEFLLWCEDMRAEPVLAVYAGYSLKSPAIPAGPGLESFVQDALDEIEYVCGPENSRWGKVRAENGHPAPFPLRYVEIGNEDFFDKSGSYDARFTQFFDAIKRKYPGLKLISTVGLEQPAGARVRSRQPDVLDEHYYRPDRDFVRMAPNHYEGYSRSGPEIFVGEWGAFETEFPPWDGRSQKEAPTPNMKAALGDAAWMAAMERNSDLISMQCYAPLLVNIHGRQWRPNLIGYDALTCYGSPSYYAMKLFSTNVGDEILAVRTGDPRLQASVTRDKTSRTIYLKLVNTSSDELPTSVVIDGVAALETAASVETLAAALNATNSIEEPLKVRPVQSTISTVGNSLSWAVAANSVTVVQLKEASQ